MKYCSCPLQSVNLYGEEQTRNSMDTCFNQLLIQQLLLHHSFSDYRLCENDIDMQMKSLHGKYTRKQQFKNFTKLWQLIDDQSQLIAQT